MVKFDALASKMMLYTPRPLVFLATLASVALLGCQPLPQGGVERGAKVYNNCKACHGADGQGDPTLQAPAIAGLGAWYVEVQLHKFRVGHRGKHADDPEGLRMRPLSKTLRNDDDLKAVAEYVASLPKIQKPPKTVAEGDPGRGAEYYKTCVACHGAEGVGMQALGAPDLTATQDWYQLRQLQKFKAGIRGRAEGDVSGAQMAAMINALPDETAMKDVVAYIQKLKK